MQMKHIQIDFQQKEVFERKNVGQGSLEILEFFFCKNGRGIASV
jgi:hypothetical protein